MNDIFTNNGKAGILNLEYFKGNVNCSMIPFEYQKKEKYIKKKYKNSIRMKIK